MDSQPPLISVVMAINRDAPFLSDSIQSILSQTYNNFEFIIVANACSDELWNKLNKYTDPRIKLHRTTLGQLTFNLNYGINFAKGKYIARMDDDDISLPERLEKQVAFLERNQDIDIVGTFYNLINSNGKLIKKIQLPETNKNIIKKFYKETNLAHPSVMFRKTAIVEVGGYHISNFAEDYDLWIRLAHKNKRFANIPEYLISYRTHEGQSTAARLARRNLAYTLTIKLRFFIEELQFRYLFGICYDVKSFIKSIIKGFLK